MQEKKVYKYLADDRKIGSVPEALINWGMTDWTNGMMATGWNFWANIPPSEVMAAGTLVPLITNLGSLGLRMQLFETPEDGIRWLDSME